MTTLSKEVFKLDVDAAQRAAQDGPLVVVDGDLPLFVVISYQDFKKREAAAKAPHVSGRSLADVFRDIPFPEACLDMDFPKMNLVLQTVDFD